MHTTLGSCHYGSDDVATFTAVRPGTTGWIAVCDKHCDAAENDGYTVSECADVLLPDSDEVASAGAYPSEPTSSTDTNSGRTATSGGGTGARGDDLAVLDEMLEP